MASRLLLVHKQHRAACELAKEWEALSHSPRRRVGQPDPEREENEEGHDGAQWGTCRRTR